MMTAAIVVGVDGSAVGLRAVDLAVREARLRDRPIRVVCANTWASHPAWVDVVPTGPLAERLNIEPQRAVQEALDHVTHAACPVLVTRGITEPSGDVLVGVDGSPHNEPAVDFAFEEAALRGAELVALHAWTGPVTAGPGDMLPLVFDPAVVAADETRVLAEALAGWRTKYPDVVVHRRVVRSRPGPALVEASGRAQLIVLGAHGHQPAAGFLVGSVTHLLLHQTRCPIAVIRPG